MKCTLMLNGLKLGEADLKIEDESMGCVGGYFHPSNEYERYRKDIQALCEQKGIANIVDYPFQVIAADTILECQGGIGIMDFAELDEIYLEADGLNQEHLALFKESNA